MNTLFSISVSDLTLLRNALVIARNQASYNEKRCRDMAGDCSSQTLASSFLHAADLARMEFSNYQRLLTEFQKYDY